MLKRCPAVMVSEQGREGDEEGATDYEGAGGKQFGCEGEGAHHAS
jgi:hypothetical protein